MRFVCLLLTTVAGIVLYNININETFDYHQAGVGLLWLVAVIVIFGIGD